MPLKMPNRKEAPASLPNPPSEPSLGRRQVIQTAIESIEAKVRARRSRIEKLEDRVVAIFGTIEFLIFNLSLFGVWIVLNSELIPGIKPFDPFPYIFLTTAVSLEAIILAIFVLITQNRQERINSLREEMGLQIDIITEQENTKILKILAEVLKKMGVDTTRDPELKKMLEPLNQEEIERQIESQLR
uniref:DUF1003 domain-containing protein n=1 Tax=candidate division WWE3 bacterium TaxID=2053526 RepID=A0A832DUV7_UNCKA